MIWLPNNLVVGVASPLENRFLIIPDKLAVRSPISIEPIPQRGRCTNDDPDCRYRVVKCEDGNVCENLYPTNSLWQIESLQPDDDAIIAAGKYFAPKGIATQLIEKDYYVTEALRTMANRWESQVIFKGGTSLSKGWQLIDRFSEDIDLFLNKQAFTSPLGANRVDKELVEIETAVAICRLLWDNALRRGEIVSLDRSSFIPQERKLMILGKGTLELQSIDLNPAVVTAINDYLLAKSDRDNPALFVSNNGNRLDGKDIARIVKKYAEPVGIDLSPHRVRHSAITAYLDVSEGNVRAAQSLSRHQNLSTF